EAVRAEAPMPRRIEERRGEEALPEDQQYRREDDDRGDRDDRRARNAQGSCAHPGLPLVVFARAADPASFSPPPALSLPPERRLPLLQEFEALGLVEALQQIVVQRDGLH